MDKSIHRSANQRPSHPEWAKGIFFPLLLAVLFTCGTNAATRAYLPLREPYFYLHFIGFSILFVALYVALYNFLVNPYESTKSSNESFETPKTTGFWHFAVHFSYQLKPREIVLDAIRIIVCWLPYFILLFPGIIYWDTGDQIASFFGIPIFNIPGGYIWDHHPFLDTYIYGGIIWLSQKLTGGYYLGLAFHSILQMVLASTSLALWLAYLKKRGLRLNILKGITVFFLFFPMFPIMFMSMSKDVTNVLFLALWTFMFAYLMDSDGTVLKSAAFDSTFIIISFLVALTKKTGLYIIVLSLLFVLFSHRKKILKGFSVTLAVILALVVDILLPRFYYPAAHIVKGESAAAIVMPIELLARAAHDHPEDVTAEEKKAIDSYLVFNWDQISQQYNPYFADSVTGYWNKNGSRKEFLKAWIQIGLRHPKSYLNGFFCLESGWITFGGTSSTSQPKEPYPAYAVQFSPRSTSAFNKDTLGKLYPQPQSTWATNIVSSTVEILRTTPLLGIPWYIAIYTSVLPCFILYYLWRRRKYHTSYIDLIEQIPYLLSALFLFACPISLQNALPGSPTRYAFALLILSPLMLGLVCSASPRTDRMPNAPSDEHSSKE